VVIGIPCLLVGGTEVHTLALATALHTGGYRVSVCCYHEHDAEMVDAFRTRGIDVDVLNIPRSTSRLRVTGAYPLFRAFAEVLSRRRPDVAHIQYMTPGAMPVALARAVGVPRVIATVHVTANHYGGRRWIPKHFAARLCDAFLCVSKTAESSFFGDDAALFDEGAWRDGRRHFTIHNCVELADGNMPAPNANGCAIGIVGRLDRFKGHDILLDAFARVRQRHPKTKLMIIGDGERRAELERQSRRLNLNGNVSWIGRVPPNRVSEYLRQMDIVAMPSRPGLEGFGLVAAEAMSHSKPVVASRVDGLVEVVGQAGDGHDAGGLLVPPYDSQALASALEHLIETPAERESLGRAGRRRVEQMFSPQTFADRHLRLYAALCGANG
jgi:glycosyltransferase involved in cell wall biosynthesis